MRYAWPKFTVGCSLEPSLVLAFAFLLVLAPVSACAQNTAASGSGATQASVAKIVGTIKTVQTDSIVISAESGGDATAKLTGSTKILRVPPGEKDLKNATALQLQDLQPGDRVLVRGQTSTGDVHTISALSVIVMKQADVSAKQEHERDDWQKRGVGGLVTKVDPQTSTITISTGGIGTARNVTVHVANITMQRRYAPESVKFDDAKPSSIDQIKVGDQLRARGTRSADGSEITAEEVVTGAFRNIAGTITAIDSAGNTMTVQDAIRKAPVVVKVSSDSQMKKVPPEMAQRIAMRLKKTDGDASSTQPGGNGPATSGGSGGRPQGDSSEARSAHTGPGGTGPGGNGPPDIQRMLSRLPNSTLAELKKGDAVMIVSTQGADTSPVTAITLLAGVEAILTAAPNRTASSLLSPWSLGASGGEGEGAQ